jgi:hypothetical protein
LPAIPENNTMILVIPPPYRHQNQAHARPFKS